MQRRAIFFCVGCVLAILSATVVYCMTCQPHHQRTLVISDGSLMLYNQSIEDIETEGDGDP